MMKTTDPAKTYDSIEYGILLPDAVVKPVVRRKRMSWPKCLCITLAVIVATLFLITLMGATAGYFWMKHHVRRFTTTEPRSFPIHPLPDADLEMIKDRAKLFYDTILAGHVPEQDFAVTEDELNAFIAHSDYLRGNAVVHVTENLVSADLSLPAKGMPGGKGRFFVGEGTLALAPATTESSTKITTEFETPYKIKGLEHPKLMFGELLAYIATDGSTTVNLVSGQFYNWVAPADYIAKQENLLEHMCDDDDDDEDDKDCENVQTFLNGLERISIGDRQITFHARSADDHRRLSTASDINKTNKASSYGSYARRSLMKVLW